MGEFKEGALEFCEKIFKNFGMDTLSTKLISKLYMSKKEIAMEDLASQTGYSLASISTKAKFLINMGMIKKIKKPGSKKIYYFMEKDLFKITEAKLEKAMQIEINPAKENIPKILKRYKKKDLDEEDKEAYEITENYYKQILKLEKGIEKLRKYLKDNKN